MTTRHKTIRVLICNRYTLFRDGIKALLPGGTPIEIVGEAGTARQAINQTGRLRPDVVLMDLAISDLRPSEATRRIIAAHPDVKVLILSLHDDQAMVSHCLEAGAAGYIRNTDCGFQLQSAIDTVCKSGDHRSRRTAPVQQRANAWPAGA